MKNTAEPVRSIEQIIKGLYISAETIKDLEDAVKTANDISNELWQAHVDNLEYPEGE